MFHVKPTENAAAFSGLELDGLMVQQLQTYADWLRDEGMVSGGIGPAEADRVEERHIADSLLFASQIPEGATQVWDLGSGVGLPGIPLAIALPDIGFRLVDRSARRTGLLRRITRILDLGNCQVETSEINRLTGMIEVIVSRAALPAGQMRIVANRLLTPGGVVIMGGSWQKRPEHAGWETVEIPAEVLDHTIWLLIMRRE